MKRTLLLLLVVALPIMAMAQGRGGNNGRGPRGGNNYNNNNNNNGWGMQGVAGSALSISSENGERFLLILNGIKQNMFAQSRVRIEGLPQVVNDVQIIFDDNRTPAISKTITFMDPIEGGAINLSMRIVRDRSGNARLAFNRMTTLERDYRPEQGEYIMSYGHDNAPRQVIVPTPPPPPPPPMPMDPQSFAAAMTSIKSSNWDETRLSTAKTIANANLFTVDQIITICKAFTWEESKLGFAKYAYKRTIDNRNYFQIGNIFTWDASKTQLNDFINANR